MSSTTPTMRANTIREKLSSGEPTLATHLFLASPTVIEAVGHTQAFDYVEFMAEYSPYDMFVLENMCRAAEVHGLGTMIKIDFANHRFVSQRSVGAGFEGVLFANPHTVDDVNDCIKGVLADTPEDGGLNDVAPRRHAFPYASGSPAYVQSLRDVVKAIMIEKASAVEALERILETPGVDLIQWGYSDYAQSIGNFSEWNTDPTILEVERRVIETCVAAGMRVRAEIIEPDQAKRYADMGVRDFGLGFDLWLLHDALKEKATVLKQTILDYL